MKVYRISDRDAPEMGFYRTMGMVWHTYSSTFLAFTDRDKHPCPRVSDADPKLAKWWNDTASRYDYVFGFRYKRQMTNWINGATNKGAIKLICENPRFMIREYDTEDCVVFKHQCVFILSNSELRKEYHFSEVFG